MNSLQGPLSRNCFRLRQKDFTDYLRKSDLPGKAACLYLAALGCAGFSEVLKEHKLQ
jgi:hypothetical protein